MADSINPNNNKTSNFLPRFYRSDTNKKFTQATLDQLVQPGTVNKINGYIGRRNAKASTGADIFVDAVTKSRQDYQLEPGLVVRDSLDNVTFFKDYQDYINQLEVFGADVSNHSRINKEEFYSWDPHIDWDKFVNFQNYYWLPYGPDVIRIAGQQQEIISTYTVSIESQGDSNNYVFTPNGLSRNPTLTLYKGQTYKFDINSPGNPFSIKILRSGGSLDRYEAYGLDSAVENGTITFTVPINAPDVLYYVSEFDIDLGGVFQILSIDENTKINVEDEILGKKNYTLSNGTPLSNGMKISFLGNVLPEAYASGEYYVEGVGTSISLIRESSLEIISGYTTAEAILFDTSPFDRLPFSDATAYAGTQDYLVINRASPDRNPWSRYNRWFHKDVVNASAEFNSKVPELDQVARAVRPIIEFEAGLKLFNYGETSLYDIDLIDTFTTDVFSTIEGSLGYNVDGVQLINGQRVLFTADTDNFVKNKIYRVEFIDVLHSSSGSRQIHLVLEAEPVNNEVVVVKQGTLNQGLAYWFNGTTWKQAQQKTKLNQAPLFDIVDDNNISFSDTATYDGSTFAGTKVFSYKEGTGSIDANLGFPLAYKNISNIGDIVFNFNILTDNFKYKEIVDVISKNINVGYLIKVSPQTNKISYVNGWKLSKVTNTQAAVRIYKNSNLTNNFNLDIFDNKNDLADLEVRVFINGKRLDKSLWSLASTPAYLQIVLATDAAIDDVVTIKAFAKQAINSNGYYEIPISLQNNPLNNNIETFTLGEVIDHVSSIVDNLTTFEGTYPGPSNLRDLGDITSYGTKFVQHSGPMGLSLYHLTNESNNIIKAIEEAKDEYTKFKRNFISVIDTLGVYVTNVAEHVNLILQEINKNKPKTAPYYFSDMLGYGASVYNEFTVIDYRIKTYSLTNVFNLTDLSNKAVYVYLNSVQLLHGHDYTFSDQGFIVIQDSVELNNDDVIAVYEYDSTDGCFIPQTPTKLGIWPKYEPKIYLDTTLITPRIMIQGHDGSQVLAYGDYRDELILEIEKRIYNNIKVEYDPAIFDITDFIPSYVRTTDYTLEEFNQVLAPQFYKWTTFIDRDFSKSMSYDRANPLTYNYNSASAPDGRSLPGYWRGIYRWLLDTDRPNLCPWEMLGFTEEPNWWVEVYGPAPYTKDNLPLWEDLSQGLVREPGKPVITLEKYVRPFLSSHIPVDSYGEIQNPTLTGLATGTLFPANTSADFVFGDVSPVESAWRRSSYYPFGVLITAMLLSPGKTFGTVLDRSRVVRNLTGQLVYKNTGLRIRPQDVVLPSIYSSESRVQTAGIINYVVDYILSGNLNSYPNYIYDLKQLNCHLSYRLGAFTSKEKFNILLDSKTPTSAGSVFVPQEDFDIVLNVSSPVRKITYSGVIITKLSDGYEVKGYSRTNPYFKYYPYLTTGYLINVGGISESYSSWTPGEQYAPGKVVKYNNRYYRVKTLHSSATVFDINYYQSLGKLPIQGGRDAYIRQSWDRTDPITVPYGTRFREVQEVVDFLLGYGEWLKDQGFVFDEFNNVLNVITNWETSAKEFMFWTTQNWSSGQDKWSDWLPMVATDYQSIVRYNGDYYQAVRKSPAAEIFNEDDFIKLEGLSTVGSSVISLSPAAKKVVFSIPYTVVDDVKNSFNGYEIFKVDGTPLPPNFLNSYRDDNSVSYTPEEDGIYGASFFLVQKEQVVILKNTTMFNDTIYNPESGYRQERVTVSGYVSTDWYGAFDSPGFIFDQAKIQDWDKWTDYALGDIVKYKEFYYSSKNFIAGTDKFDSEKWIKLDEKPTPKLLPNWTYKASQFEDFYSLDSDNFDVAQQKVAQHLIGYQKRQYLENIIKNDVSEFKFYQGMIIEKGTQNVLNKLFDVLSAEGQESLDFYEEWAVRVGQYGASAAFENIEFVLKESEFKNNPQGVELVSQADSNVIDFVIRQTPTDVYLKPLGYNGSPWPTVNNYVPYLRTPGYVRQDEVAVVLTTIDEIVNQDIDTINNGDYIWCGFEGREWNVYRYTPTNINVISAAFTNGQLTLETSGLVKLEVGSYIGIETVSFKGFYKISDIIVSRIVLSAPNLETFDELLPGTYVPVYTIISQRASSIDVADKKFSNEIRTGELLWTDDSGDGKWATWEYNPVYSSTQIKSFQATDGLEFGRALALNKAGDIAAIGSAAGEVLIYTKSSPAVPWTQRQTISRPFISVGVTNWSNSVGYSIGDIVYYINSYYEAIDNGSSHNPSSSTQYWKQIYFASVIAMSADGTWLATGSPTASNASVVEPTIDNGIITTANTGIPSELTRQGVVSLYKKDNNNQYTLVGTITSPAAVDYEEFGSSLAFGNNVLFVGASKSDSAHTQEGYGKVYQLAYEQIEYATALYNPFGSAGTTLKLSSTLGIEPGMTVTGQGFTLGQTVVETFVSTVTGSIAVQGDDTVLLVTNIVSEAPAPGDTISGSGITSCKIIKETTITGPEATAGVIKKYTLTVSQTVSSRTVTINSPVVILSEEPDSTPDGRLKFVIPQWVYSTAIGTGTNFGSNYGQSMDVSADNSTLVVTAPGSTETEIAGKLYIYKNVNNVYTLNHTINGTDPYFGKSVTVSDTGEYVAVSSTLADSNQTDQGAVIVYKSAGSTYSLYQSLTNVRPEEAGYFGSKISFMNDYNTLVVYSLSADTFIPMTFDKYSEKLYPGSSEDGLKYVNDPESPLTQNQTTFDDNATNYNTKHYNSGRVDVYDRYANNWIFSESLPTTNTSSDKYGASIAIGANHIFVGASNAEDRTRRAGLVYEYSKYRDNYSWTILHKEINKIDLSKVKSAFVYNKQTNNLITYLDVIDPVQGKIPGPAEQEIKYKAFYDPATYSVGTSSVKVDDGMAWTKAQVGMLWWDLRTVKFLDSHDNDPVYRNSNWSTLFPGASVDIYEWVETSLLPEAWDSQADTEAGIALGISGTSLYGNQAYSVTRRYDNVSKTFRNTYYYWVKNKTTIPNITSRNTSAQDVASLIANPRGEGYKYLALTSSGSFSLVNLKPLLEDDNVVLSVQYWVSDHQNQNVHSQWKIVSRNTNSIIPSVIEQKWFDSLCGKDEQGRLVPDPTLPNKLRYGIENRPRQSMFINRFEALKQFIEKINLLLLSTQLVGNADLSALEEYEAEPNANLGLYDVVFDTDLELRFANVGAFKTAVVTPVITNGSITGVTIVTKGNGYVSAPYIDISGTGVGAKIRTIINTKGQVIGATVISPGYGYTDATSLSIRSYSALVHSDTEALNTWSIYTYDLSTLTWSRIRSQNYDTRKYWSYADWYATGYNQYSLVDFSVGTFVELNNINPSIGQLVKVRTTSNGEWVLLLKYADSESVDWTQSYEIVGSQNGTIQFSSALYQFADTSYGFDGSLYDANIFDNSASTELRKILNCVKDNILIDELRQHYLDLFFTCVLYAHSEQNYLDWIFKTSFVKAKHNVGPLAQHTTYRSDNLADFESYVDEVKPYRTKIREYVSSYASIETSELSTTDFDLQPAYKNNQSYTIETRVFNESIVIDDPLITEYPWKHWIDNVGFTITEIKLVDGGSNYHTEPVVRFFGNSGSGASARAFISNGKVNRILLLSKGSGYLKAPTVILDGGLDVGGTAATAVAYIGESVVRSSFIKMKFDRVTQNYFITKLEETESGETDPTFIGTGSRLQFPLKWAPDVRIGKSSVTVNGVSMLRDDYRLIIVKSTARGYTSYSGSIIFDKAIAKDAIIIVNYLKDWSLLNAADRIQYYYNPQTGDIGKDLSQLMTGVDYGGVIINGLGLNVSEGWDSLPYFTDKWDSFDSTFDDYIVSVSAGDHTFTLPYVPEDGVEINTYHIKQYSTVPFTSTGVELDYPYDPTAESPKVTVTRTVTTTVLNSKGGYVLTLPSTLGIAVDDIVTVTINGVFGYNTVVTEVTSNTTLTLDQIIFGDIPSGTIITFTRTLVKNIDYRVNIAGLIVLTEPAEVGNIVTISAPLAPVRLDPTVLDTFIGDGETDTIVIPSEFVVGQDDQFIFRKSTSDGSVTPQDSDYDTALTGGDLSYSSATGLRAEDIIVDGDGFVTTTTSPATEEVVPGHIFDAVAIKVYDKPNSGSANIKVVNYVGNGSTTNFAIGQQINSLQAVIVKVLNGSTSLIKTAGNDYTVNYPEQRIEFETAPANKEIISIYSFGFSGSNILDLDYFVGNGETLEFITKAPWSSNITSLVYINGVPEDVELFETDSTYESNKRVGIRFNTAPAIDDIINFVIVSGNSQTFAITKTERIATDGRLATVPYTLINKIGDSRPEESNMIVRVNQEILASPSNNYFTIKGNKLTYLIDNATFPPYSLQISDIIVYIGNKTLSLGTDYVVDLSVISIKLATAIRNAHIGEQLVVSIVPDRLTTGTSYTYIPGINNTAPQIKFSQVYSESDVVEVISSYQHDILEIQRTAVNVTSTVTLTPNTIEYYNYAGITAGYIKLNRPVINESYVWITKNNILLTPSVDYKLNLDKQSVKLTTFPEENDVLSVITYSSNVLTDGIAYMQFKDMLNRVHYKRLSANKQTQLVVDLNYNDTTIEVVDASNFDIPNPAVNKPGVVEIRGERIEYFTIDGNVLGQLRRGTLGTGTPTVHRAGAFVQDIGPSETIPYIENTVTEQVVSDGSNVVNLTKITPGMYTFTNPNSNVTKTLPHDIEVFVGGYPVNSEWASGVSYAVGAVVTIGSYTYRCTTAHTSTTSFYTDIANWTFFIGNIRLKKDSYQVHNVTIHSESPEGDVDFDAEFTADGTTKQIQLTTPVSFGTQITVIRRNLTPWDGKYNTSNIRLDDNKIAGFLRATPGIWYSDITKYD